MGKKGSTRLTGADLEERQNKALELRSEGLMPKEIVQALNKNPLYSPYTERIYYADIKRATVARRILADVEREDLVDLEIMRLDVMYRRLAPGILKGDVRSIMAALRLIHTKSAILGLNAPVRTQIEAGVESELGVILEAVRSVLPDDQYRGVLLAISEKMKAGKNE
jgi:hypothetical protein